MNNRLIHLYAPKPGGVSDYVDLCVRQDSDSGKFAFNKNLATLTPLPEQCLIHYSGYGFANRGAPLWLLNKVQIDRPRVKSLGIFFHELYAFGPPWGSAFWLSPVQRHIARRLAEMSDYWITNSEKSYNWLCQYAGDKPNAMLPVFSNVGEIRTYTPERSRKIIVFGGEHLRTKTYSAAGISLFEWAKNEDLRVHDIGPEISNPAVAALLKREGVKQHGRLDSNAVGALLKDAMFGILAYQADCVAKSGVYAAYCSHGVCPILISNGFDPADGLIANRHYIAGIPKSGLLDGDEENIGAKAWHWYQPHSVCAHVATLSRLINLSGNE